MKSLNFLLSLIVVAAASSAYSQQVKTDGLPIKLGDTTSQVQAAFQTKIEPESYETAVNKGGYTLRLRTKGVWVFFNKDGKTTVIRLDAPFAGTVSGVKVGDTLLTLKKQLGEPVKKPFKFGLTDSYLYYPDDTYSARFDVNEAGEVETIFLNK